jgi:peptidyl-prolyl cis-trans isomerase C
MKIIRHSKFLILGMLVCVGVYAANGVPPKNDFEFVATVNGVPISKALFDLNLQAAITQGQKDSPQLRESIRNELINRQLIVQEVVSQGLDKEIDMQTQIAQLRQNLYLQVLVDDHFKKNPITNEMLKEEYEKQKQYLGGGTDLATQYKISQIVLKSESEAIAVIGRLKDGEPFAKVAKQLSLDTASKAQGGLLGWVSAQQVPSQIADILGTLSKGGFSQSPIKAGDVWVIVRVDDTRSTKLPSFEASQNQLRQAIVQQYLVQTVKRLRESAKVVL